MAGLVSRAAPLDDAALLSRAADGDWQSIATLYDRYRDGAIVVAMSVLGDASEAEDVVHDAFVDLPRMARSFDPGRGKLVHWLYRSVRNRAIDQVRRRARWLSRMAPSSDGQEGILAMTPERGASPGDRAEARELIDLVARLDGRHAHVIRLAFVDGWSHSEVARLTGLPLGTVKTRIRNGLRQLRALMAQPDEHRVAGTVPTEPIQPGIFVVCSPDPKLAAAVSSCAPGLARAIAFDDRSAIGTTQPTGVVVDLRSSSAKSTLRRVVDAGWQTVPIVVVRGAKSRGAAEWPSASVVEVGDAGDVPRADLELAVTALLSAVRERRLREAAIDQLLRSDGPAIVVGDRLGRVRGVTSGAALLFGRTRRQLIGTFVTELSAMPRDTTERQWQVLASTGQWSGRTAARRPTGAPLALVGRAWMPAGGGFVGVYKPAAARRVRRGGRLSREASPSRPQTHLRSARPTASAARAARAAR